MTDDKLSPKHAAELAATYKRLSTRLLAYALRLTGDDQRAMDLTMQAFAEAAAKWDDVRCLNPDGERAMWMITVIKRRYIDEVRKRATAERHRAEVQRREQQRQQVGPEDFALSRDLVRVFDQAIEEMPAQTREVAHRKWRLGLTNGEIADELAIAKGTVAWHVHTALETFHNVLNKFRSDGSRDTPEGGAR